MLDPSDFPAQFPAPDGLPSGVLRDLLGELAEGSRIVGLEITAFEAPEDEVEKALPVITRIMVDAPAPALTLRVPLVVEARAALNWEEAH